MNSSIIFFYKDEVPIDIEDEQKYTLEEIAKEGKIFLKHDILNRETFHLCK